MNIMDIFNNKIRAGFFYLIIANYMWAYSIRNNPGSDQFSLKDSSMSSQRKSTRSRTKT